MYLIAAPQDTINVPLQGVYTYLGIAHGTVGYYIDPGASMNTV